jgi:hypothetical protein
MTAAAVYLAYDPNDVKPGWVALLIVLALAVATFLLWRSMNTQLGRIKVPKRGEVPPDDSQPDVDGRAERRMTDEDGDGDSSPPKS